MVTRIIFISEYSVVLIFILIVVADEEQNNQPEKDADESVKQHEGFEDKPRLRVIRGKTA